MRCPTMWDYSRLFDGSAIGESVKYLLVVAGDWLAEVVRRFPLRDAFDHDFGGAHGRLAHVRVTDNLPLDSLAFVEHEIPQGRSSVINRSISFTEPPDTR